MIDPITGGGQVLDDMELEQERGITIKAHAIAMEYKHPEKGDYRLNLIDTPGHVDFNYEVSRSLAACEGAVVLVDASQGIEAQTIANIYLAIDADLVLLPVMNKIDLESSQPDLTRQQIVDLIGCEPDEVLEVSAKVGTGTPELLEKIVEVIPPPTDKSEEPLQALIFDSLFDNYRGAIAYIRVVSGTIVPGMQVFFHSTGNSYKVDEVGLLRLGRVKTKNLSAGDVGYIIPGCKEVAETRVGDTIGDAANRLPQPLPGYKEPRSMVFSGLFPADADDYAELRSAIQRLRLNDASLQFEPETSTALGFGFRCGFLGLLHLDIIQERLEREYD